MKYLILASKKAEGKQQKLNIGEKKQATVQLIIDTIYTKMPILHGNANINTLHITTSLQDILKYTYLQILIYKIYILHIYIYKY